MKTRLKDIKKMAKAIMTDEPKTRNSDDLLYLKMCERINPSIDTMSFTSFIHNRKSYKYPPFESVSRARRIIQAECVELAAESDVEAQRMIEEEGYREWAKADTITTQ